MTPIVFWRHLLCSLRTEMHSSVEHIYYAPAVWAKSQEPGSEIETHEIQSLMRKSDSHRDE